MSLGLPGFARPDPEGDAERRLAAVEAGLSAQGATGVRRVASDAVSLAALSTGTRTLWASGATGAYLALVTLRVVTAGTAGTVAVTLGWTDDSQAETLTLFTGFSITAKGQQQASAVLYVAGGTVTWAATLTGALGTPAYSVDVRLVSLP